jgi:5-amino-6-(5-phosphoribosylamino)uracil reductase
VTIRLVLAVSLDGRLAPPQGGPARFGAAGDRRALEEALAWADGCLLGAGSLRAHRSSCLIHGADLLAERAAAGRCPQPPVLLVSRHCPPPALEPHWPFWRQPFARWLLSPAAAAAVPGFDRVLTLPPWPQLAPGLAAEGLQRLVLLGGAHLAGAMLAAAVVDELQLTICPLLLGGPHTWLPPQLTDVPGHWEPVDQRSLGGGELLLLYRRCGEVSISAPERPGPRSAGPSPAAD